MYRLHLYSNVSHNHILLARLQHSTRPLNKAHVYHIRSDFSICFSFFFIYVHFGGSNFFYNKRRCCCYVVIFVQHGSILIISNLI